MHKIDILSRKFETKNADAGYISNTTGDPGGKSYGLYQIALKPGTLRDYVNYSKFRDKLLGYKLGSRQFDLAWKEIAHKHREEFAKEQYQFLYKTHYMPVIREFGLEDRSSAVKSVIFSTSVQHGVGGTKSIIRKILGGRDIEDISNKKLIESIYRERTSKDDSGNLKHFSSSSYDVQRGVSNRFKYELNFALNLLKKDKNYIQTYNQKYDDYNRTVEVVDDETEVSDIKYRMRTEKFETQNKHNMLIDFTPETKQIIKNLFESIDRRIELEL